MRPSVKHPVTFRLYNREAIAYLPSMSWGLETLGAYGQARGWHEATQDMVARGRPLEEGAARTVLMAALSKALGPSISLVPVSRVSEATHEARKAYALELASKEELVADA